VDLRNQAEAVTLQVEKELQEHGGKIGPQERGEIESSLNRVKELMKGEDGEALKKGLDELNKSRMKLGEAIYKAQQDAAAAGGAGGATATDARAAGGPPPGGGSDKKGGDDVIDAEYEVKK
jgi:molecular chaperone DnaK